MAGGAGNRPPYQVVARLSASAAISWGELDALALEAGFDPLTLPPDRLFNWLYALVLRGKNETERDRMIGELHLPLPGQEVEEPETGPWSEQEMAASFKAAKSQLTG